MKTFYLPLLICSLSAFTSCGGLVARSHFAETQQMIMQQPYNKAAEAQNFAAPIRKPVYESDMDTKMARRYNVPRHTNHQSYTEFSTLGLDADDGSYHIAKQALQQGKLPNTQQIRIEEFINSAGYDYPHDAENALAINHSMTRTGDCSYLIRIGIQSHKTNKQKAKNITLVIDTSGSMESEQRLAACQQMLGNFFQHLQPQDSVAIVRYAGKASLLCPSNNNAFTLNNTIQNIKVGGQSNLAQGVQLGFHTAHQSLDRNKDNCVILISDGIANKGRRQASSILETVKQGSLAGISLFTIGVGSEGYNDVLMEQLANQGNGTYSYLNGNVGNTQMLGKHLHNELQIAAYNTKAQIRFNTTLVKQQQLLGYQNRRLANHEFFDNRIDGADLPSDTSVTILYQIKTTRELFQNDDQDIGEIAIRWQNQQLGPEQEIQHGLDLKHIAPHIDNSDFNTQLALSLGNFAIALKSPYYADWQSLLRMTDQHAHHSENKQMRDLHQLAIQASALSGKTYQTNYRYQSSSNSKRW